MNRPWLILNMLIFGTGFATLGAAYTSDGPWGPQDGAVILGLFGLFLGAVFGGRRGRMVQDVFGPLEPARAPDSDTGRRDW
jgi:hypothetical protein